MAQRGIREYDGKKVLFQWLAKDFPQMREMADKLALVTLESKEKDLLKTYPWLKTDKLVVKPDQLFGKRGKHGLVCLDAGWHSAWKWICERMNKETVVGKASGRLTHFLIEPFTPHNQSEEFYVAIRSDREEDVIYFSTKGGIYVEENWDKVMETKVPVAANIDNIELNLPELGARRELTAKFIRSLYKLYAEAGFSYLEINPFTYNGEQVVPLDLVAKVDDTALFEAGRVLGDIEFPAPFGSSLRPEEEYIKKLDEQSGASLKLTILNPQGRIWTMVAGGGASVIYADTVCDLGFSGELANYGEYSGDPSEEETYQYAKTVLDLMTREKHYQGKVLLIGGGIANFTDVAKTFKGIIRAITEQKDKLIEHGVKIYVRRGGPNYKEGLERMRQLGKKLGLHIEVYGPETHMTRIVAMSLEGRNS